MTSSQLVKAKNSLNHRETTILVNESNLESFVGKKVFNTDRYYDKTPIGVAMGLAWTSLGGATLYVETALDKLSGKAELRSTGQLGEVMKESTQIAYTYAKVFLSDISPTNRFFETASLHMHHPEGATPKDGPSAGITMVTSIMSQALQQPVRQNLAMTGEITLTGKVLPIGGVKEKTIAAKRSGVKTLIFPFDNRKDYEELPDYIKKGVQPFFVSTYRDVYEIAFGENPIPEPPVQPSSQNKRKKKHPQNNNTENTEEEKQDEAEEKNA